MNVMKIQRRTMTMTTIAVASVLALGVVLPSIATPTVVYADHGHGRGGWHGHWGWDHGGHGWNHGWDHGHHGHGHYWNNDCHWGWDHGYWHWHCHW